LLISLVSIIINRQEYGDFGNVTASTAVGCWRLEKQQTTEAIEFICGIIFLINHHLFLSADPIIYCLIAAICK
jgi:hypothetical protein